MARIRASKPAPLIRITHLAVLLAAFFLAACRDAPVARGEPGGRDDATDSVVQFLVASAANDFHTHRPPDPVRFRDVRIGHIVTASGEPQYFLCGRFLPAQEGRKADWTPFATIKTSGYEQWIGDQAEHFCEGSAVNWDKAGDLSSLLQSRLDSLR